MKVYPVLLATTLLLLMQSVVCIRKMKPNNETSWPILYYNEGHVPIDMMLDSFYHLVEDSKFTPDARSVIHYNSSSEEYERFSFHSKLSKTTNCRPTVDKWDCDDCKDILPDGVVVRSFATYPLGINGNIVVSAKEKTIYVLVRGASSLRNKITYRDLDLVPHPGIPGAKVQRGLLHAMDDIRDILHNTMTDQTLLHPDYAVYVTGHSFGAAVGSLVMVDLYQTYPQLNSTNLIGHLMGKPRVGDYAYAKYVGDENIQIRRIVQEGDYIVHRPDISYGFVHEGDEYWLRSEKGADILFCPGPYETRNCSNSVKSSTIIDHLKSFGTDQDCKDNLYNII